MIHWSLARKNSFKSQYFSREYNNYNLEEVKKSWLDARKVYQQTEVLDLVIQ